MKIINVSSCLIAIFLLNSCKEEDKKVEAISTDGPNVIIDSTGFKNTNNTAAAPVNANQSNSGTPTLVTPQQQQTAVQGQQQSVQLSSAQMQQMQQQALQAQQKQVQQVQQPQQVQAVAQQAHPQFTDAEFKKMQNDALAKGVQLNPAHGQPGHRCDIYVGQPLDSKPVESLAKKPAEPTINTPQVVTAAPQAVKVAPGMNPAHGEPGHRCDIAVGAPLNSKPINPAPVVTTDSAKGGK